MPLVRFLDKEFDLSNPKALPLSTLMEACRLALQEACEKLPEENEQYHNWQRLAEVLVAEGADLKAGTTAEARLQ
jgi:hypothetical protein